MYTSLKQRVLTANKLLVDYDLVTLTWGNVSEIDRALNAVAIKPSGVAYSDLKLEDIVVVNLDGGVLEGTLNPSSDLATHLFLYNSYDFVGGVVHTHSRNATSFAQAGLDLVDYGTTHADHFFGSVPCSRKMTPEEIKSEYELNTGKVIVETFANRNINAHEVQGCLVNSHGPFVWGKDASEALENALVLETIAEMNLKTLQLNHAIQPMQEELLNKHYLRKHGVNSYYGQK